MRRRISLAIGVFLVVILTGAAFVLSNPQLIHPVQRQTPSTSLPVPTDTATGDEQAPTSVPTPTLTVIPSPTTQGPVIAASQPTTLYIPRLKKTIRLSDKVCPTSIVNGETMLDPDRKDYTKGCYFISKDYPYSLPGTDAPDLAVFAGHTARTIPSAAFNVFYNWQKGKFTVAKGDELWVKTVKSGKRWLVYAATDLMTPRKYAAKGKVSLMNDPAIWGAAPTPGVAITIGCRQSPTPGVPSSENIVIKWRFSRVEA